MTTSTLCQIGPNILNITTSHMQNCASVHFLTQLFGQPINNLTSLNPISDGSNNNLATLILGSFNTAIVAIASIIFAYIVVVGVINSAQEGKLGGRDMGHFFYPIRVIVPVSMLVPIKGGFCMLQIILLHLVLIGINGANYVWQSAMSDVNQGFVPTTPDAIQTAIVKKVAQDFVYAAVATAINSHPHAKGKPISGSSMLVWDSPYATDVLRAIQNQVCNTLPAKNQSTCQQLANNMFQNSLITGYSDLSSIGGDDLMMSISGENPKSFDARIKPSGTFKVNPNLTNAGKTPEQNELLDDIYSAVGYSSKSPSGMMVYFDGPTPAPSDCNNNGGKCSLKAAASNIQHSLIQDEKHVVHPGSDDVIGTGDTCSFTCRNAQTKVLGSAVIPFAPISGKDSKQACLGADSGAQAGQVDGSFNDNNPLSQVSADGKRIWTDNCYKRSVSETDTSKSKYSYIAGQNIGQWWYGSRVYLQTLQHMADNITALAKAVEGLNIPSSGLIQFTGKPGALPNVRANVTTFITQKVMNAQGFDAPKCTGSDLSPTEACDHYMRSKTVQLKLAPLGAGQLSSSSDPLENYSWEAMVKCYSPLLPASTTRYTCMQNVIQGKSNVVPQRVQVGGNSVKPLTELSTGIAPWIKQTLSAVPSEYQEPLKVLLLLNSTIDPSTKTAYISDSDFKQILLNIIDVLSYNHVYPGSAVPNGQAGVSSDAEISPLNATVNKIFNNLMGQDMPGINANDANNGIMNQIYSLGNTDLSNITDIISNGMNTVSRAQQIGLSMINTVGDALEETVHHVDHQLSQYRLEDEIIGGTVSAVAAGAAAGGWLSGSLGSTIATLGQTALQMKMAMNMFTISKELAWLPIAMVVLSSMFVAGISFAVILPLTPFFLFWAGQIAWVLSVIEALVAAPLMALAIMAPGGHGYFGHMMPGLKSLFGVIFRPVLMVLGLLIGMILTFVVIRFSSQGFQIVATQILHFASSGSYANDASTNNVPLSQGVIACILLVSFCSFMMLAFTKCFSLIYMLPEKVTTWIGGIADRSGAQDLQQMTQSMSGAAEKGGSAAGQTGEKTMSANQSFTKDMGGSMGGAIQSGQAVGKTANEGKQAYNKGRGKDGGGLESE